MNTAELKLAVDRYLGIIGTMTIDGDFGEIEYFSPTGVSLVHVKMTNSKPFGWYVGGVGQRYFGDDLDRVMRGQVEPGQLGDGAGLDDLMRLVAAQGKQAKHDREIKGTENE